MISDELARISSHCIALGAMAMDVGAMTPFPYCLREREYVNDLIEELCGARLTYNYHRIGGVGWDLTDSWRDKVLRFCDHFEGIVDEFNRLVTYNPIFIQRLAQAGPGHRRRGDQLGAGGPEPARLGRGLRPARRPAVQPVRRDPAEDRLAHAGGPGRGGHAGRRLGSLVRAGRGVALVGAHPARGAEPDPGDPEGEFWTPPKKLKPKGEASARVEAARGDMHCYVVGDGAAQAYRARFRTGSFDAIAMITEKSRGLMLADLVALIASLDIVAPEIDR